MTDHITGSKSSNEKQTSNMKQEEDKGQETVISLDK